MVMMISISKLKLMNITYDYGARLQGNVKCFNRSPISRLKKKTGQTIDNTRKIPIDGDTNKMG